MSTNASSGQSFWDFLDRPIWKIATTVLFPALISIATTIGYTEYTRLSDAQAKVVDSFVGQANGFELAASQYVSPVIQGHNQVDEQGKKALLENIINQTHALQEVVPYLKGPEQGLLTSYQTDLLDMRAIVANSRDANLDPFYNQARKVFTERQKLIDALRGVKRS